MWAKLLRLRPLRWALLPIAAILLLMVLWPGGILSDWAATGHEPGDFYVSPTGNDSNDGSLENPWGTLRYAITQLLPGDVLHLREGHYYESDLTLSLRGTANAPITIQSYPGEQAVIDGGIPDFRQAPQTPETGWELIDPELQLYRSRQTFNPDAEFVGVWLLEDDPAQPQSTPEQVSIQLLEYDSAENLESTNYGPLNGLEPIYVGPGIQLRSDGHLYIRLVSNPGDMQDAAGNPIDPITANTDPNQNRLAIFFAVTLLTLDGASYITFKDLTFANAHTLIDARNGANHITLSDCHMHYGTRALLLRDSISDVYKWEISSCDFNNGVPHYVYWTDVKNRGVDVTEAYPEFQSTAITGPMRDFEIHHNLFRNAFDAVTVTEGSSGVRIFENIIANTLDDAINLSKGISNVEVAHNMLWHVFGGISILSSNAQAGPVYIHHNVIDNSAYHRGGRPGNYRAQNWPVWTIGSPFPDHDNGDKHGWWKFYNNTVITREDNGHLWSAAGPSNVTGNPEKAVLNNIFYVLPESEVGRVIFRNEHVTSGSRYDGNVFYRSSVATLPLFSDFGDGGRYYSLQEFQSHSGTGWELHGLQVEPGFNLPGATQSSTTSMAPIDDPVALWEQYRPTNYRVSSPGASYEGLDWPQTTNIDYRGALPMLPQRLNYLPLLSLKLSAYPYP